MTNEEEKVVTEEVAPARVVKTRTVVQKPTVRTEHPQNVYETKKSIFRTYQAVWYILGFVEVMLAFRFILKLLAANPGSGFAILVYGLSGPLVFPFFGVLRVFVSSETGSVFEWPALIAMAVYWILAYGIIQLFQMLKPVTPQEVEDTVDTV